MKKVLISLMLLVSVSCYSQKYSLLEINAKWNDKNSLKQDKIGGIRIDFGWLEDQPKKMQSKIKSVPILVLFKDDKPIYQWIAGIDFKLEVTEEEFENVIKKLN